MPLFKRKKNSCIDIINIKTKIIIMKTIKCDSVTEYNKIINSELLNLYLHSNFKPKKVKSRMKKEE